MDRSPISRIPAELRVEIYQRVLTQSYEIYLQLKKDRLRVRNDHETSTPHLLALPSACRQLREESLHLVFQLNRFSIGLAPMNPYKSVRNRDIPDLHSEKAAAHWQLRQSAIQTWFRQVGQENFLHLRGLQIELGSWNTDYWGVQREYAERGAETLAMFIPTMRKATGHYTARLDISWDSARFLVPVTLPLCHSGSDAGNCVATERRSPEWKLQSHGEEYMRAQVMCEMSEQCFVDWIQRGLEKWEGYDVFAETESGKRTSVADGQMITLLRSIKLHSRS